MSQKGGEVNNILRIMGTSTTIRLVAVAMMEWRNGERQLIIAVVMTTADGKYKGSSDSCTNKYQVQ